MSDRLRNADGTFQRTHGMRHTRLYYIWCAMKERCSNHRNKRYDRYGGRGIHVCEEWANSFEAFAEWSLQHGYAEGLSIDRIDNQQGYAPDNCRWVSQAAQNRNYSRNVFLTYKGETKCITDWAAELGIQRSTISFRLRSGKPIDEVLSTTDGRTTRWKKTISPSFTR